MDDLSLFLFLAGVPVLGVMAQWLAWQLRLPSILLLLAFGILLGQFVNPDELLQRITGGDAEVGPRLLFPLVSLAVAVILFEGGLTLRVGELRGAVGSAVTRLCTIGALVSWLLTAVIAHWLLQLDLRLAVLLGALLVVTGPTVIAPLLRHIRPARGVGSIAKWEGIVIDPIGAVLAVLVFEELIVGHTHGLQVGSTIWLVVKTAAIGMLLGGGTARVLIEILRRYLIPDYLHGVAFLATALGTFALSNYLQEESGLVTVTILGIVLANQKQVVVHHIVQFKEQLGVFLISCLFITLGARLQMDDLLSVGWPGLLFVIAMILFVRPASVIFATIGSELNRRERIFLAFLAPRGIVAAAVASVFSLKLVLHTEGVDSTFETQAQLLVPITFLVIVGTVLVYGLGAGPLARYLGLADPNPQGILFAGAEPWLIPLASTLIAQGHQVLLVDTNYSNVARAKMEGIPADCSSILSEHVREELDLSGIGRLIAVTANDEVNALAVGEFAHVFGRANVYQLTPHDGRSGRRTSVSHHLRGRAAFSPALTYGHLLERAERSFEMKRTKLSETFTYESFVEQYGPDTVLLFVQDADGQLQVATSEMAAPGEDDTLFALVPSVEPIPQVNSREEQDDNATA